MTPYVKMAIAAALFLLGGLAGGLLVHTVEKAALADQLKAQVAADQKVIDKRAADEQAAVDAAHAQLKQSQADTSTLNLKLSDLQTRYDTLTEQISHVQFHPAPVHVPTHPAVVCPGHPVSSPEFLRLYNEAADIAAPAAGPAGDAGGVHAPGAGGIAGEAQRATAGIPALHTRAADQGDPDRQDG